MKIDEQGRSASASVQRDLERVAVPEASSVVRHVRARRRARVMAGTGVLAVIALIPAVLVARGAANDSVKVSGTGPLAELPHGSVVSGAWVSIPKSEAGLRGSTAFRTVVSTGSSLIAGGAGIWRSTDGLHWTSVAPSSLSGPVTALGVRASTLVGVTGRNGALKILTSSDDGRTWSVSRTSDFGPPAPQMDRPFVSSLLWSDSSQEWVAGGGASDGYGAVWVSSNGRDWRSVLPANRAGSADVVPDGFGGFLAWWADRVWMSPDGGRTWSSGAPSSLPPRTTLNSLAPGGVLAAGIDPVYFGVLFMINNAIGLITPPVGVVLNTVAGVGRIHMDVVTKGVIPFMIAEFIVMFAMVLFPKLVLVPAHWFY